MGATRRRAARWKRMQGETDAGRASDEGGRVAQRREVSAPIGGLFVRYPWSLEPRGARGRLPRGRSGVDWGEATTTLSCWETVCTPRARGVKAGLNFEMGGKNWSKERM